MIQLKHLFKYYTNKFIKTYVLQDINMSIDEGLWYLHTHMIRGTYAVGSPGYEQPYGYWNESFGYPLAAVGAALEAFQMHGHRVNMDYDGDPYVETVQRALNYLLYHTYFFDIGVQPKL